MRSLQPFFLLWSLALSGCGHFTYATYDVASSSSSEAARILRSFALQHGFQAVPFSPPPKMATGLGAYVTPGEDPIMVHGWEHQGRINITMFESGAKKTERFAALEAALRTRLRETFGNRVTFKSDVGQTKL